MALILKHQSRDAFLTRLRDDVRDAAGSRMVHLASRILALIDAGDLTDVELRAKFGKTVAQWNTAKARWQSLVAARNTIRGAVGE